MHRVKYFGLDRGGVITYPNALIYLMTPCVKEKRLGILHKCWSSISDYKESRIHLTKMEEIHATKHILVVHLPLTPPRDLQTSTPAPPWLAPRQPELRPSPCRYVSRLEVGCAYQTQNRQQQRRRMRRDIGNAYQMLRGHKFVFPLASKTIKCCIAFLNNIVTIISHVTHTKST